MLCTHCRKAHYDPDTGICPACGEVLIPIKQKES